MGMKGWILGGGVAVVAVGAGAATWAAVSFFSAGPQPADVLPADTIAYVSLDLDPSGGQKIAALRLANRFPALKKEIGLSTSGDIRRKVVESITEDSGCDVDYAKDVEPWLGSTIGFGMVGATDPQPVVALEVKDATKAKAGVHTVLACTDSEDEPVSFVADGDFLVFGRDEEQAHNYVTSAKRHSLTDDADFKKWTSAVGDSGILTAYAAPKAGSALVDAFHGLLGDVPDDELSGLGSGGPAWCPSIGDPMASLDQYKRFKGGGATLRFSDHGLELEFAADMGESYVGTTPSGVTDLPADVGGALGIGFPEHALDAFLSGFTQACGDQFDKQGLYDELSAATGLDVPGDIETLTSKSAQLVVGKDIDVEAMVNSEDPSDLPVALRIKGDPTKIKGVVAKLADLAPGSPVFDAKAGPGSVSLGFDPDLRDKVAAGGKLGDDATFKAVVPHADKASSILYLDLAGLKKAILQTAPGDKEFEENVKPLQALALSGWLEDGTVSHGQLVLTAK